MLKSQKIEDDLRIFKYYTLDYYDNKVEWHMRLPFFMISIKKFIRRNNRIPSPDEFINFYITTNSLHSHIKGIKARLLRSYPSLIRDIHFECLLKENNLSFKSKDSEDINEGVDFTLFTKDGTEYYLHLYINTSRAREARELKNKRHTYKGFHIDLPLNFNGRMTKQVGDFYLYSKMHINYLKKYLDLLEVK